MFFTCFDACGSSRGVVETAGYIKGIDFQSFLSFLEFLVVILYIIIIILYFLCYPYGYPQVNLHP